jgi:tetratricopeptide (TPR) repeat protein
MKKITLFVLINIFFAAGTILAGEAPSVMYENANKLYRQKDFSNAIEGFEEVLKTGAKSAEIYYNLGNSYYKNGDIPHAILNYERAKKINPGDEDILFNLRLAYSNTVDKIEPIPLLFYQRWWQQFLHLLAPDVWSILTISLFWLTLGIANYYLFAPTMNAKRNSFLMAITFLLVSGFSYFISWSAENAVNSGNSAVVMEPTAYIKSSPDEKSTNLFLLHEGTRVEVTEETDGWKKIKIANGNVGWVMAAQVEVI